MSDELVDHIGRRNYVILGGAAIISVLIGFAIGVLITDDADAEATLPPAVQATHDDYFAAWNEADGKAVVAMMAPAGRHYCPGTGDDGASGEELADFVDKGLVISDIEVASVVTLDTPGLSPDASQDHIVVTTLAVDGHHGYVDVLHLRGTDGNLEVLSHRAFP